MESHSKLFFVCLVFLVGFVFWLFFFFVGCLLFFFLNTQLKQYSIP